MTTSRLKFELIDSSEPAGFDPAQWPENGVPVKPPGQASSTRRPEPAATDQLAALGQKVATSQWPENSESAAPAAALDPRLLHDLAEGFEFLHRQLEESDAELERSREQSRAFERDARRWEQEAARLSQDGEETRRALEGLRREFEESRDGRERQQDTVGRIVEEMAEIRAARAHLEELAAEQQRALVLSLELLKRYSHEVPAAVPAGSGVALEARLQDQDHEKDIQIADLNRLIEAAGEEGARLDMELVAVRAELLARVQERDADRALITSLRQELDALTADSETVRSELASTRAELAAYQMDRDSTRADLESTRSELDQTLEALKRLETLPPRVDPGPDLNPKIKELERHRSDLAAQLRDAESEIALQNAEVESRGAIITALENALEEQNASLRSIEDRFLGYAEQVQSLQLQRLEMPTSGPRGIAKKLFEAFSPPRNRRRANGVEVEINEEENR